MVSTSLKTPAEIFTTPPHLIPHKIIFTNYVQALTPQFLRYFANSFIVALFTSILSLIFAIFAAYSFSRMRFPGRKLMLIMIIFTQLLPLAVLVISIYRIMHDLNLLDTYIGLIIAYLTFDLPVAIWLLQGFFAAIPRELEEAAEMDGCTGFSAFLRIMLPLAVPGIVATAAYVFFMAWQEFMFALTFMTANTMRTLPVGIMGYIGEHSTNWGLLMAASVLIQIPIFIIFGVLQNKFVAGLTSGGVKG
ncbi:carbohydrate ABC transporter permease [Alicyclobacillus tolerans]|nr:carbohydrate ABC transporter permease [Alicyclobacillus tolerans]